MKSWKVIALLAMLLIIPAQQVRAEESKFKVLQCDNLEVSIPLEDGEKKITLSCEAEPDLSEVNLPNGFTSVSALYKFEPADLSGVGNEKILVQFKVAPEMIPEDLKLENLSIFCLSRDSKQLIELDAQERNREKMTISVWLDYARYFLVIGSNLRIAEGIVIKKGAAKSGSGKQCEGGVCPL